MAYDNVIFDLYGTLIDIHTDEDSIDVWKNMCEFYAEHGIKYNPAELRSRYRKLVKREEQSMAKKRYKYPEIQILGVFERLAGKKEMSAGELKEFAVKSAQEFRKISTRYIKLYDGTLEMLDKLANSGRKLYVLSNAQRVYTLPEIQSLGLEGYFEDISLSSDFGAMKPDARFYQQILERNHLNPGRTIMVGNDAECDIAAARRAGLHTCYVHSDISPESDDIENIQADILVDPIDMAELYRKLTE